MAASDDQSKKLSQDCKEDDLCVQLKGNRNRGGWITFPFISGNMIGTSVATTGAIANLVVYLIQQFNVRHIDAVQIANITNGSINLAPIAGAIISDSYFGCFPVIAISTAISMLGISLLTLTTTIHSLRPSPCPLTSSSCNQSASSHQFAVMYFALALIAIGNGGTRFNLATMGANQFRKAKDRDIFFNWFFFSMYLAFIVASTVVIYVEDNVSWGWGFGMCMAFNLISLGLFLTGRRYYRRIEAEGSPFTGLARVVVAAVKKRNVLVEPNYYIASNCETSTLQYSIPTSKFSFLNRAALKVEGDTNEDGSIKHPWRLCTVEQVEDLKILLRIFPLWSSAIFLSTPIGVQNNLSVLQALSMDRRIGPHFSIPAGSYLTFVLVASAITISLLDRFLYPAWHKLTGRRPTPLQRVGLGHVFNIMAMVSFALIESSRLRIIRSHGLEHQPGAVAPMSAHWLILPLLLVGAGEAFHFTGQVSLYYQEFPASLRSTATAMVALIIGMAFYLSSAITGLVQKLTRWLPDNINNGKMDNVYWMLAVVGAFNFGYYLVCAKLYKYQNAPKEEKDSSSESDANATALQSPRL